MDADMCRGTHARAPTRHRLELQTPDWMTAGSPGVRPLPGWPARPARQLGPRDHAGTQCLSPRPGKAAPSSRRWGLTPLRGHEPAAQERRVKWSLMLRLLGSQRWRANVGKPALQNPGAVLPPPCLAPRNQRGAPDSTCPGLRVPSASETGHIAETRVVFPSLQGALAGGGTGGISEPEQLPGSRPASSSFRALFGRETLPASGLHESAGRNACDVS